MPALRENGPYIYPTWLPKLLAGLDWCEWKIWFQVQAAPLHRRVRATGLHRNRRAAERLPPQPGRSHHLRPAGSGGLTRRRDDNRGRQGSKAQPQPRNPGHALHGLATPGRPPLPGHQTPRTGLLRRGPGYRHSSQRRGPTLQGHRQGTHQPSGLKDSSQEGPSAAECRFCPISAQYCPERREE